MTEAAKPFWEGGLYKLLDEKLVTICRTPRGQLSIAALAARMNRSSEGLYKYLRADRISMTGAETLIAATGGLLNQDDLKPFMPFALKD